MEDWFLRPPASSAAFVHARQLPCCVCNVANLPDVEFCRYCRAPLALAYAAAAKGAGLRMLAVLGAPGCGKTVYLGMLADLLSRQEGSLRMLARGAYSVSLQQQSMSALARCQFPPHTSRAPEDWNWVHCEVSSAACQRPVDVVMPDLSADAFAEEVASAGTYPVIRAFLSRCGAALILVDAKAVERGDEKQDFLAMKNVSYLIDLDSERKTGWPGRPVAVVFTKAECSDACWEDPARFASDRTPGLWRQCHDRLRRHRFFAASVVGACAQLHIQGEAISVPLRVEPRGITDPFVWFIEQLAA